MQINLTGHHVDITGALREYVADKFERLERHFDHVIDVHVILTVEKLRHRAEAAMMLSGNRLFADDIKEDMYAAIDGLVNKLDRQIVKHKEKLKDHHRVEGSHRNMSGNDLS
ncbi:MAG: ribosome-associated translation inhibitor RaiA [Gammaproteobacteria bacterium]|jgi:putative sigma-54 modulation protein|nr:ribosome-associated translation inhibitor RaiA [Gammaproteobacteria bacterium]